MASDESYHSESECYYPDAACRQDVNEAQNLIYTTEISYFLVSLVRILLKELLTVNIKNPTTDRKFQISFYFT